MALSLLPYDKWYWSDDKSDLNLILKERSVQERLKSSVLAIKIGDRLPENLIVEILSWLPVKALLQFKSVCKSWYAIISSSDFISRHLKNYYNNSEDCCLLAQYYVTNAELQLVELLIDDTPKVLEHEVLYYVPMYGSNICGPCDGIYYLFHFEYGDRALWNPATNELKDLPPIIMKPDLPSNLTYGPNEAYGFGLDPATKEYKVVVIKRYWMETTDDITRYPLSSVLIYSLSTDSWRYWGDMAQDYDLDENKCYVIMNGCFYWLGSCGKYMNPEVIISFNMVTDAFEEIHVPDYDRPATMCLGVHEDCISFFTVHDIEKRFDIWILSKGLWTKKFTMGPLLEVRYPVGHWKNDKVVLYCLDGNLALCNPYTQEIKDFALPMGTWCQGVFIYKESLVSIKDMIRKGHREEAENDASSASIAAYQ